MCGIVGYVGNQEAIPIIMSGLKVLEYRGYDSAGICAMESGSAGIRRSPGKLVNLERLLKQQPLHGTIGIGHTRWATHGKPTVANAHPHKAGAVVVVHNGIIENFLKLKEELTSRGHQFSSDTDTEVLSHLIDEKLNTATSLEEAVQQALREVQGAYALCILSEKDDKTLVVAKSGSPLVIGIRGNEYFVASDMPAIISNTREMVIMEDAYD
jgi:glucosamine--fructose-6-phosphate aminotransferase (isomerizing)